MFVLSIPIHLMHVHDSPSTSLNTQAFYSMLIQSVDDKNTVFLIIQRYFKPGDIENMGYSLPLYLGIQRTDGGRPLILKCFPSN